MTCGKHSYRKVSDREDLSKEAIQSAVNAWALDNNLDQDQEVTVLKAERVMSFRLTQQVTSEEVK